MDKTLFWKRGAAYLMDLFCIYVSTVFTITAILFAYAIFNHFDDPKMLVQLAEAENTKAITRILQAIYYVSYFTISHWYFGKTLGKYFLGLTVHTKDGKDLSFLRSLARTFAYMLSGYPTLGIGYVIAYFRADGLSLHDMIVNTRVDFTKDKEHSETLAA